MSQAFRFDLVDLKLFLNVAAFDSLSRGAEQSNISLAAASTRIKNLELNLGVQLFNRRSRGVTLTAPGETVLHHASKVLKQLDLLNVDLREFSSGQRGQLRIGSNTTGLAEMIPEAIRQFLARYPGVAVDLVYHRSRDSLRALTDDAIDIALVSGSVDDAKFEVIYLGHEASVVITKRDQLGERQSITFAEILDHELVGLSGGQKFYPEFVRFARDLKMPLNYRIHVSSYEELCKLVEDGIGVAIVPRGIALKYQQSHAIDIVSIDERWARRQMNLCLRRPRMLPPFVDELIALIQAQAKDTLSQSAERALPSIAVGA